MRCKTTHQAPAAGAVVLGVNVNWAEPTPHTALRSWFHCVSKAGSIAWTLSSLMAVDSLMTAICNIGLSSEPRN